MRAYRLADEAFAGDAFNGEGARLYGGRWNSPGTAMVYTAQSLSLAQLELLVHLEAEDVLCRHWRWFAVDVVPEQVRVLPDYAAIPDDYAVSPVPLSTRRLGDAWVNAGDSVALQVPSTVTPGEFSLLLNPAHPGFAVAVSIGAARPLAFDSRLT